MSKKINQTKNIFENDIFQPIIAYFLFTFKYILKKKSTILMPIFSFILILAVTIVPNFISDFPPELFKVVFLTMISSLSIVLISVFSSIKALNLFKDISNEGMEILIISKPIERWQIIFVRFTFFILLGIFISIIDYIALLIGLVFANPDYIVNLNVFEFVSIYFFSMLLIYLFFGSLSILLSLKFSTKLVNSLTMGIIGFGTIFAQVVPQVIPMIEKGFEDQVLGTPDTYNYTLTDDGNVLIYKFNEWEPLDDSAANNLKKYFNSRDDLSWISGINNFVNPIS
ncbi:MAG: ABC transporter permease, partial [Mycoplasmataceae bacterium]|nr:ABC transporter permease [Mycoplasmataceae bacterium]